MRTLRVTLLGVLAAAVAATSAVAAAPKASSPPIARAAGGDAGPPVYPAIVNVPMQQAQTLLSKAGEYQATGDDAHAVQALTGVQSNLAQAVAGDKYLIQHAPPPVAAAGGVKVTVNVKHHAKAKAKAKAKAGARASGAAVGAVSPYADQFATTSAVLTLQHTIATTALGLTATASPTVLPALQATVVAGLNSRDDLIAFVHALPAPPAAAAGMKVSAHASGGAVVATWDTTMQAVLFDTDDELMQINGMAAAAAPTAAPAPAAAPAPTATAAGGAVPPPAATPTTPTAPLPGFLGQVQAQVTKTAATINKFWPPLPAAAG